MESKHAFEGGREVFKALPAGLPILFQFPSQKHAYRSFYVGAVPGDAVIMTMPMNPGVFRSLNEAYTVVVRFLFDGAAYGFETRFLAAIRKPLPLVFLSFPPKLHDVKLRGCDRLPILERAVVVADGKRFEGLMVDLGCGGCKVRLSRTEEAQALAKGGLVSVEFAVSMEERVSLSLSGMLLEVSGEGRKLKCRVVFDKDQEDKLSLLGAFLQGILKLLRD